jgi:hypothetical protein
MLVRFAAEVAEHGLAGCKIAVDNALDGFAQKSLGESPGRVASSSGWFL